MDDAGTDVRIIRFSRFALNLDRCALLDGGEEVPMRPKSFEVLCTLVRSAGAVVTQRELLDAVWGDAIVTEDSVRQCIADVRKALDDKEHDIIRTVPRRGYMFDLPVDRTTVPEDSPGIPQSRMGWLLAAAIAPLLFVLGILWLGDNGAGDAGPKSTAPPPANSIAVLRFADMSPAGDHAYLAEGIADEILHQLAQSPDLSVVARTSSFAVDGDSIEFAGKRLNVAHILEGSVRQAGNRIRVIVQLIETTTSTHRWSESYDFDLGDTITIETRIAEAVADQLDASLGYGKRGGTNDARALEAYLKGRFYYSRRRPDDLARAESLFNEAINFDPAYAEAWIGIAAIANLRMYASPPFDAHAVSKAELKIVWGHAVEQALTFGPDLTEVQMRAGWYFWTNGDRERARELFDGARKQDPYHWLVRAATVDDLMVMRRLDDAIAVQRESLRVDPLNGTVRHNLASQYWYAGRYEDVLKTLAEQARLQPSTITEAANVQLRARTLLLLGRYDEALGLLRSLPDDRLRAAELAMVNYALGSEAAAATVLADLESRADNPAEMLAVAEVHAYRGDVAQTLSWLTRLAPHLSCDGDVRHTMAWYSPFIARRELGAELTEWREAVASSMSDCRRGLVD